MELSVKFRHHKTPKIMPLQYSPVSVNTVKEYVYEHWMGSKLRGSISKHAPDTVMLVDDDGNELDDTIMMEHGSVVQARRVPGSHYRVFAGCKTEDDRIKAWVQHAEWSWKKSYKETRQQLAGPVPKRKSALGIPQVMLRKALPDEEDDAMMGIGGMLVVHKFSDEPLF